MRSCRGCAIAAGQPTAAYADETLEGVDAVPRWIAALIA